MQYTEEHYAQMYNDLPEGLKDLVLSGRLAILVSAIGSRHGLTADQVSDLEPAIEDVCLGLITKEELVENIQKNVDLDTRVANRIAAETELEILKPFEAELLISRKQKMDLDEKINGGDLTKTVLRPVENKKIEQVEIKNVSGHSEVKKVSTWAENDAAVESENTKNIPKVTSFDWDKDFVAKKQKEDEAKQVREKNVGGVGETAPAGNIENKLDKLTESINNLVNTRFGSTDAKVGDGISLQMQELIRRLEKAEKENAENKKLIENLQGTKTSIPKTGGEANISPVENIFGNKIDIDKQRKVEIAHSEPKKVEPKETGNIQITSVSKSLPINKTVTSSVTSATVDSIVETKGKEIGSTITPNSLSMYSNKSNSLGDLIKMADDKIKNGLTTGVSSINTVSSAPKTATLIFPSLSEDKKIDIKNIGQKNSIKEILLSDLAYLKNEKEANTSAVKEEVPLVQIKSIETEHRVDLAKSNSTYDNNPFKEELIPTTKEDRMRALQDKIKALNKSVSVGGKTNISASGLDPYRV